MSGEYPPPPLSGSNDQSKKGRVGTAKRGSKKRVSRKGSKTGGESARKNTNVPQQEILKERNRSYENVYNILTENLLQAKSKLQSISEVVFPEDDEEVSGKIE